MAEATIHGTKDASILSVGHQIQKPEQIPATEPTSEATKNSSQKGSDQKGRSRSGCIITGHQHNAEPVAVKTNRSVSLLMNVLMHK
jgi:hypothetical protein